MNTIINKIKSICLIAALVCFLGSCEKELDVAPILQYDGHATMTIAELVARHSIGSTDSYTPITDSVVIEGTIISCDQHGNCYKYITIQDATAGIQIKVDDSGLYPKYKVGQHVFVECKGLDLGDYRKNPQLGWWIDGSMSGISRNKEDMYIHKDGLVGEEPEPLVITSFRDIPNDGSYVNRLVKLENCYFEKGGLNPYSSTSSSTSETIKFSDGTTLIMRTSNYADFASNILPEGNGEIYGILTIYNRDYQLTIRSTDDVRMLHEENVYSVDFNTNPMENGWSCINVSGGAEWTYRNFQGQKLLSIDDNGGDNDCWLVSPAINLSAYNKINLAFDHKVNSTSGANNMKLYYSTTYRGGEFNASDWTELSIPAYPTARSTAFIGIDPAAISNPNFRIAFRYAASNNGWALYDINFNAIVLNQN